MSIWGEDEKYVNWQWALMVISYQYIQYQIIWIHKNKYTKLKVTNKFWIINDNISLVHRIGYILYVDSVLIIQQTEDDLQREVFYSKKENSREYKLISPHKTKWMVFVESIQ